MELSNDWHKRTNVRLVDILSDILKEPRPPKIPKPTHGYRIAEKAPEIVTAPGAYFPEKKGRVIPLESRQAGGPVTPAPTRTLQQMLEKLASYAPFPISGAATQSTTARQRVEGQGENRFETAIEPKQLPLVPRQMGGEVDPNLFKEKFSVNTGDPTQQGIEAAANTASLKDTPLNVSPLTPSLQSFAPGANPTPTGQGDSINNPIEQRLNSISRGLSLMIKPPKPFKYRGSQHGFESEQRAAYDKKHKPYQDFMSSLNPTPLFSRAGGGSTSPDPFEGLSEEELKKLYEGIKAEFSVQPLASARVPVEQTTLQGGHGNVVDMTPNASGTFEQKGAPVMTKTLHTGERTIPTIPKMESTVKPLALLPAVTGAAKKEETTPKAPTGSLSDIGKEIIPETGKTRYTIGDEQGAMTVPKGFTPGEGNLQSFADPELEARKKWAVPGYGEAQRAKRQKESDLESTKGGLPKSTVIGVSPGFEKTYYEAHPEERAMDVATEANKPLMDAYIKMIEQSQNIIKGNFGDTTMGRRAKREARNAAIAGLPHLQQGLAQLQASNAAIPGKYFSSEVKAGKAGTPQLVQNEKGEYVHIYPPGTAGGKPTISSTGVIGKGAAEKSPTEWRLIEQAQEKGPDGKPTANAIKAQGTLDSQEKRKQDIAGGGIPQLAENTPPRIKQTPAGPIDESALDGLTEDQKGIIRGLVTYKYPWPGSFAMSKPAMQRLIGRAERYDPTFSGPEYQVRLGIRRSFTSGKEKDDIKGLNTATGHIDSLVKASKDLANSNWVKGNAALNILATEFPVTSGLVKRQGKLTAIKTKFNAVADEMAGIFKKSGSTNVAVEQWRNTVKDPTTATPEMWKGFIDGSLELMGSRILALRDIYESGMGQRKDFTLLSANSRKILSELGVDVDEIDRVAGPATKEGTPTAKDRPRAADFGGNPEGGGAVTISKEEWVSRARKDERNNQYSDAALAAEYDKKYGGK